MSVDELVSWLDLTPIRYRKDVRQRIAQHTEPDRTVFDFAAQTHAKFFYLTGTKHAFHVTEEAWADK